MNILSNLAQRVCWRTTALVMGLALAVAGSARADLTDIASTPLGNSTSVQVKPNIMLLMDTSGSMGWGHMPDELESVTKLTSVGYKNAKCNVLYYNPETTYELPKNADGSRLPTPSFDTTPYAPYDAYNSSSTETFNLATQFRAWIATRSSGRTTRSQMSADDPAQRAYYYKYTGTQTLNYASAPCTDPDTDPSKTDTDPSSPNYDPYASRVGTATSFPATGGGTWTRVLVQAPATASDRDERQNFAIWYTYYRTRMALTKSAMSLAFSSLNDNYRVGFISMFPKSAPTDSSIDTNKYLAINDFNTNQRTAWFNKLFAQTPFGSSPAREGLARVGRHYAGKQDSINTGMTGDPVQYACQQNFTIMTTDGYWNDQSETPGKGPVGLDGTTKVGQQDGTLTGPDLVLTSPGSANSPRPIWEGFAADSEILTTKTNTFSYAPCNGTYYSNTTTVISRSTRQITAATAQRVQYTEQTTKSTRQTTQVTSWVTKSTSQWSRSTAQNLIATSQTTVVNSGTEAQTTQQWQDVTQLQKQVRQDVKITTTLTQTKTQLRKTDTVVRQQSWRTMRTSSSQTSQTTSGVQSTTSQPQQTTTQRFRSTVQWFAATSRNVATTSQVRRTTTQIQQCDASTELCQYVASCTVSSLISCNTLVTGPTLVTTCSIASPNSTNNYTKTDCATTTGTPTNVATCIPATASSTNNYTTTDCSNFNTAATPVQSCTDAAASSSNNYTATTCSVVNTGPTAVQTCTASAGTSPNWITTTCGTTNTGPTGVSSCSGLNYSGTSPNWISSTCTTVTTAAVFVDPATCPAPGGIAASAGNNWTTTTCTLITGGPAFVQPTTGSGGNCPGGLNGTATVSWVTKTCSTTTTSSPVADDPANCIAALGGNYTNCSGTVAASSSNAWKTQTWSTSSISGPTAVDPSTCTGTTAASLGNTWTTSTCTSTPTNNFVDPRTPSTSCVAAAASSGNGWVATTCTYPTGSNNATTTPSSCTASLPTSSNSWVWTQCSSAVGWVPVAPGTCAVTTGVVCGYGPLNNPPNASPSPTSLGTAPTWTNVSSCLPGDTQAAVAPDYVLKTCQASTAVRTYLPPSTVCVNVPLNATGQTTTCGSYTSPWNWYFPTTNCPPATSALPTAGNNYLTTSCRSRTDAATIVNPTVCTSLLSGKNATNCTGAVAASVGTPYVRTFTTLTTAATPTSTCSAPSPSSPSWITTTCSTNNTGPVFTDPADPLCVNTAKVAPNWIQYSCTETPTVTQVADPANCTAVPTRTAPNYILTTCSPTVNAPVAVALGTCPASTATVKSTCTTTTVPAFGVALGSCTPGVTNSGSPNFIETTCTYSRTPGTGGVGVASCSDIAADASNNYVHTGCLDVNTPATGVASCVDTAPSAGNSYVRTTCGLVTSGPTAVDTCTAQTPSAANNYTEVTCGTVTTTNPLTQTCVPQAPSAANNFVGVSCTYATANKIQYSTTTTTRTTPKSGGVAVGTPTIITYPPEPPVDLKLDTATSGQCYVAGVDVLPTIPGVPVTAGAEGVMPVGNIAGIVPGPALPAGCTSWASGCLSTVTNSGGSVNSLADVAQYYYINDLRPLMANKVVGVGNGAEDDRAYWQHMTTFSIALGVSGTLNYRPDYKSATTTTGDFADIRNGVRGWPLWPDPALTYTDKEQWNNPKSIDDFWHAAVNGRGQYFSAGTPQSVVEGLQTALSGINARLGAASAAATSSLQPVAGDNFAYTAQYTTSKWYGELEAHLIDLSTGAVSATKQWGAQSLLDAKVGQACDNRTIFLMRMGATKNLTNFTWNTKACDPSSVPLQPTGSASTGLDATEQAYFDSTIVPLFSQYAAMTDGTLGSANQRSAAGGANLVNYLRGQNGLALAAFTPNDLTRVYRYREHVLGDIVDAQPTYVRKAVGLYADSGYTAFRTSAAIENRTPMVYSASNDGMLHAFYAGVDASDSNGGKEAWAVIPSTVVPNLYRLADANYGPNHRFSVDGTPVVGDAFDSSTSTWKTILVAGLNAGGKAYYALDVTNPVIDPSDPNSGPKGLWEFKWSDTCYDPTVPSTAYSDCHLGYTFGKPIITKLYDGTWVVMFTSGYNNVNSPAKAGDGVGYLYVLNAMTGKIIYKLSTGAGDATTPSGLGQISNFVDDASTDNRTVAVYGADLMGNIWRFDVNDNIGAAGQDVMLLGTAKTRAGVRQPITTRPELTLFNNKPFVMVATGKLLGATDLTDTTTQSVYGFKDNFASGTGIADLRATLKPMVMTTTGAAGTGEAKRTVACDTSDPTVALLCGSTTGWVLDLPDAGERVNVDMRLFLGTLVFGSNVPSTNECDIGGYSYLNYVNFSTGTAIETSTDHLVSTFLTNALVVGVNIVQLPSGKTVGIVTGSDATQKNVTIPIVTPPPKGQRISWREITQ